MDVKSSPEALPETEGRIVPKVSVVVPTFDSARFLGKAIQSVLDQTFLDWEPIGVHAEQPPVPGGLGPDAYD